MMNTTPMYWVGDWSGQRCRLTPDRLAVIEPATDRKLSYRELDERACRLGHWLQQHLGLTAGDVVVLISENRLEALDAGLACGKTGIVLAPISHRLSSAEASLLIERLQPKAILFDDSLREFVDSLTGSAPGLPRLDFGSCDSTYARDVETTTARPIQKARSMQDPFLYIHTGGSTGLPKICRINHEQMHWNAIELLVAAVDGLGRRRELLLFPLFHIGGWNTALPILYAGGCLVMPHRFDATDSLRQIDQYAVNHFGAVEAMLRAMSASPVFDEVSLHHSRASRQRGRPAVNRRWLRFSTEVSR